MPFPASIPVKYSEDDAQFISIRPLVRQTFSPGELVDMIVSVTGKDVERVRQILRSGTIVFNSFRYWWDAIDVDAAEIAKAVANYPDSDPTRPFRAENCIEAILESAETPPRHSLRFRRADAARKRLFRMRSLWDALIDLTALQAPSYLQYSYAYRADLYSLPLDLAAVTQLVEQAERVAPRSLRQQLTNLPKINKVTFLCRR